MLNKFLKLISHNSSNKSMVYMEVYATQNTFGQLSENASDEQKTPEINKQLGDYFLFFPFFPDCQNKDFRRRK